MAHKKQPLEEIRQRSINAWAEAQRHALHEAVRQTPVNQTPNAAAGASGTGSGGTGSAHTLTLVFDDIASASLLVGDAANVDDWNNFFVLPSWGTPFTGVEITGSSVTLKGASSIEIKPMLMYDATGGNNTTLLQVIDTGCVTQIHMDAFSYCYSLTDIVFPACTNAGYREWAYDGGCFGWCSSLVNIQMPLLETAGDYCFSSIAATTINLPSLQKAGNYCFQTNGQLTSVSMPALTVIGDYCFSSTGIVELNLPSLVTGGFSAIGNMPNLTSVSLPNLLFAGEQFFRSSDSLQQISIPKCEQLGFSYGRDISLPEVSGQTISLQIPTALYADSDVLKLYLDNTVTVNGNPSFQPFTGASGDLSLEFTSLAAADTLVGDHTSLVDWNNFFDHPAFSTPFTGVSVVGNTITLTGGENIFIPAGAFLSNPVIITVEDEGCVFSVGDSSFGGCTSLTSVVLPNVISLGAAAFSGCTFLTSVTAPNLLGAGNGAFTSCAFLATISFPSMTGASGNCFESCTNLTAASLPEIKTIGYRCFFNCGSLASVSFPKATRASYQCFESCSSITSVSLPALKESIYGLFTNCVNLSSVSMPAFEETSGADFVDCDSLTTISLPSLKFARNGMFNNCSSLTSVSLPALTSGANIFSGCISLTNAFLPEMAYVGVGFFQSAEDLTTIELPKARYIYESTFNGSGIQNISLPLTSFIRNNSFGNCLSIENISIPSCVRLGLTTGDDSVFTNITGRSITLTVPAALMTCNGGAPDGDIQYLQTNNTVTIVTI